MTDYCKEFKQVIRKVSSALDKNALGKKIDPAKYEVDVRKAPHKRPTPKDMEGKMVVYAFLYEEEDRFLKIGKAGPKSKQRFSSHHYNPKASRSTLAASLKNDPEMCSKIKKGVKIGDWILENCQRIDVLIDADLDISVLALIEAALHYYYEPKYEGFDSQRKAKG